MALHCFIAVHAGETNVCVTIWASLKGNIPLRDVWTKVRFLDLYRAAVANGTILIFFLRRANACCIDDRVHLAVCGWVVSTSHVLRFISARVAGRLASHEARIAFFFCFFLFVHLD